MLVLVGAGSVGGTAVVGAIVTVFVGVIVGVLVDVEVLVDVDVTVGVNVFVGVGVRVGRLKDVLVGYNVEDGRRVAVAPKPRGGMDGSVIGVFVQVGGNCREVAVWVGSTNLSGIRGGGKGLR